MSIRMNQFSNGKPKTKIAQEHLERRNKLIEQAKGNKRSKRAVKALADEYGMRVYTPAEIQEYVAEYPRLETDTVIGKTFWNTTKANFTV